MPTESVEQPLPPRPASSDAPETSETELPPPDPELRRCRGGPDPGRAGPDRARRPRRHHRPRRSIPDPRPDPATAEEPLARAGHRPWRGRRTAGAARVGDLRRGEARTSSATSISTWTSTRPRRSPSGDWRRPVAEPATDSGLAPESGEAPADDDFEADDEEEDDLEDEDEDLLEETPDFLQDTPEGDRLWFEQSGPKDFDFDDDED